MRVRNIIIGLLIIAFAVFGILEVAGVVSPVESVVGDISFAKVVALTALVTLAIISISHGYIYPAVLMASFIFMVIESNLAYIFEVESGNIINNWALFAFTVIICIGLAFILPKKKKHSHGKDKGMRSSSREHTLGSYTEYIDCATFTHKVIENNLGKTTIRFENTEDFKSGSVLSILNNLGHMQIFVPSGWRVSCSVENNLGGIKDGSAKSECGPELIIKGDNNLGGIDILRA